MNDNIGGIAGSESKFIVFLLHKPNQLFQLRNLILVLHYNGTEPRLCCVTETEQGATDLFEILYSDGLHDLPLEPVEIILGNTSILKKKLHQFPDKLLIFNLKMRNPKLTFT